jgi:channel protein (hemolysin III family)
MNIISIFLYILNNINTLALFVWLFSIPTTQSFSQLFSNNEEFVFENLHTDSNFDIDIESPISYYYGSIILLPLAITFFYYSIDIDSKSSSLSNDNIVNFYNIPNRLDYNAFMYCEGCPKPLLRGILHGLVFSFIIPIGWAFLIDNCPTLTGKIIFSFYMLCNLFGYLMSYIYHVHSHKYGPIVENFVLKVDRLAIFINIASNFTPLSLLFMKRTGIYLLIGQWGLCVIGAYRIFYLNRSIWWEPLLVGVVAPFFVIEMWEVQTPYEFWLTMSSYVVPTFGCLFTAYKMDLTSYPDIWGHHENFHLFNVFGSVIVYFINYSLAGRSSEICW